MAAPRIRNARSAVQGTVLMRQGVGNGACSFVLVRIAVFGLVLFAAAASPAQTRIPDRIRRHGDDRELTVLHGNHPALARPELDRGRLDRGGTLERLALVF